MCYATNRKDLFSVSEVIQYPRIRWAILPIVIASAICGMMMTLSVGPLVGEISRDLRTDVGAASFSFIGIPMLVMAASIGLFGFLIDRFGVFSVIIACQSLAVLATASIALLGDNYSALMLIRMAQGIAAGGLTVSAAPALALWFPRHEFGRAMGIQGVSPAIGMMLGLSVTPMLSQAFGNWRFGMASLSAVVSLLLLFTLAVAAKARHRRPSIPKAENQGDAESTGTLFRMPVFWVGMAVIAIGSWISMVFSNLSPGFLAVPFPVGVGYGAEAAGMFMALFTFTGMVGAPLGGYLVDKIFRGRAQVVIMIGFVLSAVFYTAIIVPSIFSNRSALIATLAIAGFANPFVTVTILIFAGKVFPTHVVGRVCGLWMSVGFFAGSAGIMVGSLALHTTGNYRLSMLITGVSAIIGLLITLALKEPHSRLTSAEAVNALASDGREAVGGM
jgi:MFS family permease